MAVHVNGRLRWLWLNFVTGSAGEQHHRYNTRSHWNSCPIRRLSAQISSIATACPHTDALRTGWSAPGSLRGNPSHGPRGLGDLFVRSRKGSSRCVIDVYPRRARSAAVLAAAVPSRVAGWPVQGGLFGR